MRLLFLYRQIVMRIRCSTDAGHTRIKIHANISHEYLGENLIILFAQPHFRNLLFRILNEDFIVRSVAHKKH